ncbi:hypothetical protein F0L68_09115 [Solihabitans fulvus]|uniref:Immunity protein 10 of polymorphic toxin system n=1 Tax=Solihabitans fulvus TaxID=1892852 RepID=A0A5B2XLK0_9PSEU|nr:Imm10 family immunity protein [Solihabitans fulvus]KAA2263820.1 hypothetical protein F0L68_09115 [Solihabitans fulvus]
MGDREAADPNGPARCARAVAASSPDDALAFVAFAETADGDGWGIVIQATRGEFTEQDRRLGMDTYSVSNEHGASVYGGVRACAVDGDVLRLALTRDAAEQLGVEQDVEIQLPAGAGAAARLRAELAVVLTRSRAEEIPQLDLPPLHPPISGTL